MKSEIAVLIAHDHAICRKVLRQIIEADPRLKIVAEVDDGESALELMRRLRPQVAVLDVDLAHKDGLAVAREVQALRLNVALIFVTTRPNERFFNAALDLGVKGYVLEDRASSEIVSGVKAVAAGHSYVTPELSDYLLNRRPARVLLKHQTGLSSLTPSERRVLKLAADYKTSKQIGHELFISVRTVDRHRANIVAKLNLKGSHALLRFALDHKSQL